MLHFAVLAEKSRKVNEIVFRTWKARNGCAYDIVRSTPEDALAVAESYAAMENPPRIIFFYRYSLMNLPMDFEMDLRILQSGN